MSIPKVTYIVESAEQLKVLTGKVEALLQDYFIKGDISVRQEGDRVLIASNQTLDMRLQPKTASKAEIVNLDARGLEFNYVEAKYYISYEPSLVAGTASSVFDLNLQLSDRERRILQLMEERSGRPVEYGDFWNIYGKSNSKSVVNSVIQRLRLKLRNTTFRIDNERKVGWTLYRRF